MPCLSLLLLLLLGVSGSSQGGEGPLVKVSQGLLRAEVRGLKNSDKQMLYCSGIPYAEPPLGPLRFKDAVAAGAWAGERSCRAECPVCAQPLAPGRSTMVRGGEDCLCLNVYAPHPAPPSAPPLPVMVWVHGGAFAIGDGGQMLYGPDFLVAEGVVVVTLNYRLGALGFLNVGSEEAPGNQGLKDQVLALRWVRDNVAAFGGDPGRVTVFGESAGGGSVHLLTLSPMAAGLFHGAIMQSGSAANPWAFKGDARNNTRLLLAAAGCDPALGDADDPRAAVDCLRAAPARALAAPTDAFQSPEERSVLSTLAFAPSLDGLFLPAEPCELLQQGAGAAVPTLAGYNSADGIVMLPLVRRPGAVEAFDAALGEGRGVCQPCAPCPPSAARRAQWGAALRDRFLAGRPLSNDQAAMQGFVRLQTLMSFALGTVQSALGRANASASAAAAAAPAPPHFLYEFAVDTGSNFFKSLFGGKGFNGSAHADELLYLFHNRLGSAVAPGSVEDLARRRLVALWTAFAKTGNPTPQASELLPSAWQPLSAEHEHFYHIGNAGAELRQRPLREDRAFFDGLWATADA